MAAKSHKSDYAILIILAMVVCAVFLALVWWGWIRSEDRPDTWMRTSRSAGRHGTMACHMLWKRLGYKVETCDDPLTDEVLGRTDVLLLIDPLSEVTSEEVGAVGKWMAAGGVLVCSGDPDYLPWELHRISSSWRPRRFSRWNPSRTSVWEDDRGHPLARDVKFVRLATSEASSAPAEEDGEGLWTVKVLLRDTVGPRITARRVGRGSVIWMADSSFLSNGRIGEEDNQVLAVNLLASALSEARGKRAIYDEFHYGWGRRETGWTVLAGMLFTTPPGWTVLSLTLAGILYLLYRGRRFGTRRAPEKPHRRSKLEYVHSIGATYRHAGTHRLTFNLVFDWCRRRLARKAGVPASASSHNLAVALARLTGGPADRHETFLNTCEAAAAAPRLSAHRMAWLAGALARMEWEVFHGRESRK
jgi:hypothetical protein